MARGLNITASGKADEKSNLPVCCADGVRHVGGSTAAAVTSTECCTMACPVHRSASRRGLSYGDAKPQGCSNTNVHPRTDLCTGDGTAKRVEQHAITNAVATTGILDCTKSNAKSSDADANTGIYAGSR